MITTRSRTERAGLDVGTPLVDFIENEALDGTGIDAGTFWAGLADILRDLTPINAELLAERDRLQTQIDDYHRRNPGRVDAADYRRHLEAIGYVLPQPATVRVRTQDVDAEVARVAGPQLVVPLLNARFAVNAANARWGSLYDALYGTDAISEHGALARGKTYNPERGAAVVAFGRRLLDDVAPLESGSHADVDAYRVVDGALRADCSGRERLLAEPELFAGYTGDPREPKSVLLEHHGLHLDIIVDRESPIGASDRAGVADIVLESAVTTIMDLEDSVAAVDVDDKVLGYRNWLGLMRGTLSADVEKGGRTFRRVLADDRTYTAADGRAIALPGRALLWVRNVGHLMTTDAVRCADGSPVPEGILDAVVTVLGSLADLRGPVAGRNSREGSVYIVKPKMHGPAEVAFAGELFARVEALFGLPHATIKIGIMDEERRTSVNLAACIHAVDDRVAFINTGFLDRTGDEIHTSMHAGVMIAKGRMRDAVWLRAYEESNVAVGTGAGLRGRGQIGKGMWAMPDLMRDMLEQKGAQLRAGATTAWVPSPTAATLHALHYHDVDGVEVADALADRPAPKQQDLLTPPLAAGDLDRDTVRRELDNSVQSILGYVVRWVDQGIGCSKVPDIHGVALMEDRATLRISSQLLANWLLHGVISEADVDDSLRRLSLVVDEQNAADPLYTPLSGGAGGGLALSAARRLIFEGARQPNGYTEPLLHEMRRAKKSEERRADVRIGGSR
ncbi:malate synthase G [Microbacterium radiodurans]|uniref:Malate synthase G n=1 Tax=Microbacterium radiodurans TaxID=661398 RepID=A0A5J5IUS7_9MICO|nr:malate synthase G [Microbacterium radiodurans]KAA9089106.1 malate synthase G [Microbacterium radiodurans]